ncbi:DUF5675 family protein [Helicobacter sp. MIT 21-1697]|uniref:DUF5675 family protein n=1 Tax=Helicobacter sp. MIT 21-1697 TaxID=2993733 RepID=UPI00224B6C8C|nr:DUF5675 family protein [Helicobacter sp. MIT 21-1697]MCX2717818.1 DUF5675 family protein [Helicobacter sp. MIT 21-1697]
MFKLIIQRTRISTLADAKGEKTTIGNATLLDSEGKVLFKWFSGENGSQSSDERGKDHRIMPRTYKLKWNFTKTAVAKNGFRNVDFQTWKDKVEPKYHERYTKWGFKNVGLLLYTPALPSFESRCIFIHIMNTGKDVEGCVGLGKGSNNTGIVDSTTAIQEFYDFVKKNGVENFEVQINEIGN